MYIYKIICCLKNYKTHAADLIIHMINLNCEQFLAVIVFKKSTN